MYKFVFIGSLYDYNRYVESEIVLAAENVFTCEPMDRTLHGLKYILYKLHNSSKINHIINLPFKSIWVSKALDKKTASALEPNDKICFIYTGGTNYLHMGLMEYLKRKYPNSKCVFYFTDLVDSYVKNNSEFFSQYATDFDFMMTYNIADAKKYKMYLTPPRIINFDSIEIDENIESSDIFFVGKEKGRLHEIIEIYELCTENGLKCDFHIMDVEKDKQKHAEDIIYNQYMSYDNVLKHSKRSRCILNYIQKGAIGITLRDYEAIGMNKFLMTNNPAIRDSDFYTEENIIWIDDIINEISKLSLGNKPKTWKGIEQYSISNYFSWMETVLETKFNT